MRELRNQSGAQSLTRIYQRVDEHSFLQDRESLKSAPWIVSATKEDHRGNHHAEHQPNMLLIDAAPQGQPSTCGEDCYQHNDDSESQRCCNTDLNSGSKHEPR